MNICKKVHLCDVCDIIMGQSPKGETCNNDNVGIPLLNGPTEFGSYNPTANQWTNDARKMSCPNDLLFCVRGSTTGRMNWSDKEYAIGRGLAAIRHKKGSIYKYYVMALLDYYLPFLLSSATGSTFPNISKDLLNNLEVIDHPLVEQKRIAAILGSLDDKIELNNRIKKNLEEQASALFKRWFVDFEFPDSNGNPYKSSGGKLIDSPFGAIPGGWRVGSIGDYCTVKSGFAFKSSWWQDAGVKVLKIKNISSNRSVNLNDCSYVEEDKMMIAKDFILKSGDLIIAMTGATIGKFAIIPKCDEVLLANQRVGKFFLGDNPIIKLPYLYCFLKQESIFNEIVNKGQGSAQPNISSTDIETIGMAYNKETIQKYNQLVADFFCEILTRTAENTRIAMLRDSLLPKLMNNEI